MSQTSDFPAPSLSASDLQAAMDAAGLIPGRSPEPVRLPDAAGLFAGRAARLRKLAEGHMLADWLRFVALLADAQHRAMRAGPGPGAPADAWTADVWAADVWAAEVWTNELPALHAALAGRLAPAAADGLIRALTLDSAALAALGRRVASGAPTADDLALTPFVVAAQQVAWTRRAGGLDAAAVAASATQEVCPVCGAPPVGGVIHVGASGGLRYLHCGVCHAAWHRVRSACVACGESLKVEHHDIEGGDGVARAEVCNACRSYTKLFMLEKAPDLDVIADDLASLPLDMLAAEEGYSRFGCNPFMLAAA